MAVDRIKKFEKAVIQALSCSVMCQSGMRRVERCNKSFVVLPAFTLFSIDWHTLQGHP